MPARKLTEFLDTNEVKYVRLTHSLAFTAQEIAAAAHIPGKELAKTVIVKIDGQMCMVVLPAPYRVDLELLRKITGANVVELATEVEFKDRFPECEVGAMPPFGNLYGMEVYAEKRLAEDRYIAFNAGSHIELIRLAYKDFERLVKPMVIEVATLDEAKLIAVSDLPYPSLRQELIYGLNDRLSAELGTILRYTYHAGKAVGFTGVAVREMLMQEIQDELRHAMFLTDVLIDLGAEPTTVPQLFTKPGSLRGMLELDLEMELNQVEDYMAYSKMAETLGEVELTIKLQEMAADEAGHARELRRLLAEV